MFRSGVISIFLRTPKASSLVIFTGIRVFSTLHRSQIAKQRIYSESACKTASNDMFVSFIWWLSFFSLKYHTLCGSWHVHGEKNESHQMKLKDMPFDAVLHADSEYTLCSAIWLWWRVEKPRKPAKIIENGTFGALEKMLITPERNMLAGSVLRRSKENNFLYRMVRLEVKIE